MSRVGKLPITVPKGIKIDINTGNIKVNGPKGELSLDYRPEVDVTIDGDSLTVNRKNDSKSARSFHGLYRNLINNMIIGVSQGFSRILLINGVGYRAEVNGKILVLNLGFSNPIEYEIEDGVDITCEGTNKIVITGIDKQRVGQVASEIRSIRPPEPYKGKGVKYDDEIIRRKIGKAGVK